MSCCSNAMWKHLVGSGEVTGETIRAAAAGVRARLPAPETGVRVFVNGTFLLAEPTSGEAVTAVAIGGGVITDVGFASRILGSNPGATVVDLKGATLAPGFVEAHAHIIAAAQNAYSYDLRGKKYGEVLDAITAAMRGALHNNASTNPWVYFINFDPSLCDFTEGLGYPQLGFAELDAMPNAGIVNLFVENASGHIAYANSTAFATCKITAQTPPPPAGGRYDVEDGKLTGVMFEPPTFQPFLSHSKEATQHGTPMEHMEAFLAMAQRAGITTVADPAVGIGGDLQMELELYNLFASLPISTDVVGSIDATCMYSTTNGPKLTFPGLIPPATPGATGSFKELIVPAVKIWSDGSTQGYTGFLKADYLPPVTPKGLRDRTRRGEADWTQPQILDLLGQAKQDNWGVLIHANGDAGLDLALGAIELVYPPGSGFRNRIEHCTVTSVDQYDRMATIGVTPTYLTNHIAIWGDAFYDHIIGPDRANRLDAARDAKDRGMIFSFHCDYATSLPGPLTYMCTAVTRRTNKGNRHLGPELAIDALEALRAVTIYPARQLGIDGLIGTITAGKRANLVHLAEDPTRVPPDQIEKIQILGTYLHGRWIPILSVG